MSEKQILPIEEMLAYDEFNDRVELLRQLDLWINNIQRMASPRAYVQVRGKIKNDFMSFFRIRIFRINKIY